MTFTSEDHPRDADGKFSTKAGTTADVRLSDPHTQPGLVPLTPAATSVLDACRAAGGTPLIVGGAVRDALEGTPSQDIDIEVHGVPSLKTLIPHMRKAGDVSEVGAAFGILKVTVDGETIDVAVPRRESKTGAGHRGFDVVVDPTLSVEDALGRRDFTINAIAWNPETGQVIAPHGGLTDLQDRVLRHTTDAFVDDPLRVLRGAQFAARFGLTMASETVEVSQSISHTFSELSVERLRGEMRKLALAPEPSAGMYVLQDTGWLENLPELAATVGVEQDAKYHPEKDVFEHQAQAADVAARLAQEHGLDDDSREVVVLATMLHDLGKQSDTQHHADGSITSAGHAESGAEYAEALLHRLGYPQKVISRITPLIREHMLIHSLNGKASAPALRRLRRRLGDSSMLEWAIVCAADRAGRSGATTAEGKRADHLASPRSEVWDVYEKAEEVARKDAERMPRSFVDGAMLKELGLTPGPQFREIITAATEAQDNEEFANTAAARDWVRRRFL